MRRTTIVLLTALVVTLFAAWWFTSFEKVSRDVYVGYSGEPRYNQYFAAEKLVKELGFESDSIGNLKPSSWLPEHVDTLVTPAFTALATFEQRNVLYGWVTDGGHLVIMPGPEMGDEVEELLGAVGFSYESAWQEDEPTDEEPEADIESDSDEDAYDYYIDLTGTGWRIMLLDGWDADATLSDDKGIIAARRQWGDGFITVLAASHYFSNAILEDSSHARLMMDVLAGYVDPGKVWFVHNTEFEPLWKILWSAMPLLVLGAGLLLLLWLLSILPRFGPPIMDTFTPRRSMMEHITAAGIFGWKLGESSQLAKSSVSALLHEAEFKHPGVSRLDISDQAKRLARITGLSAQDIAEALSCPDDIKPREFTHHMQTLQKTRERL